MRFPMSIMVRLSRAYVVPHTDNVKCFILACGHERILAASDAKKLHIEGDMIECVECGRQEYDVAGLEAGSL